MKARHRWLAAVTAAGLATLLWPGQPGASADTTLGGYQGSATAAAVHVQIYEQDIPIPASPQVEGSVGYTSSTVETGPTSRALSSYLWPGTVLGDGFNQLVKGANYPIQVNSRYPATTDSPANNTIQLTDGNGMTTSTDGLNSKATVTFLGIAGPGTELGGGIGTGLGKLGAKNPAKAPKTVTLQPLPVSASLAALVTAQNISSTSTTTVADKTMTSTAHATASDISLLGGIVKISGFTADSSVVSDGSKATATGDATIGSVSILGLKLPIDANGINLGLPALSETLTSLLSTLGIGIQVVPTAKTENGASGEFHSQVLVLTVDTKPLKSIINNVLSPIFAKLPTFARTQLQPVLDLGPKIVLTVGESDATATASPAFNFGGGGSTGGFGGGTAGTPGTPGTPGSANLPNTGTGLPNTAGGAPGAANAPIAVQQTALGLPPLGSVPRALILGALVIAAAVGWFFRRAAATVLGSAGKCGFGLVTGVPDLRKG
ncbi:MAG TPA: choice-of-anchor P family protein [Jatrophihabitantaceae bacterium]